MAPVPDPDEEEREAKRRRRNSKWEPEGEGGAGGTDPAKQQAVSQELVVIQQVPPLPRPQPAVDRIAGLTYARQLDAPRLDSGPSGGLRFEDRLARCRAVRPRVHVGNLDPMITEQEIMQIFGAFGTVTGIDMPREGMPPRSKGFCYVEFAEQQMANRAVTSLQDFVLGGRNIRVTQPAHERAARGGPNAALAAPPPAGPTAGLTAAGSVLRGGASKATVMPATLQPGEASGSVAAPSAAAELRRLTISGIPSTFEVRDIRSIFQPYGTIVRCDLLFPASTATPPRFTGRVLVEFASEQSAYGALRSLQGFALSGAFLHLQLGSPGYYKDPRALSTSQGGMSTELTASPAPPPMQPQEAQVAQLDSEAQAEKEKRPAVKSRILCLDNIVEPGEADDDLVDEVREECRNFGTVEKVSVRELGRKKRVRLMVTFKDLDGCGRAMASLNGRWFGGLQVKATPYIEEVAGSL